ncbi:MAG: preprotein translocase subunit SecA [Patescibacteria group bacterium]
MSILHKILGDPNKRVLRALESQVSLVNAREASIRKLSDAKLKEQTTQFRERIREAGGDVVPEKDILNEILPEAFAVVREAMRRSWSERHYDVQIMGGIVLHQGKIAEMKTGEGKTIVATLALYLNALAGRGAHLVTVNDYLSRRDGEGMGEVFHLLGLSTGVIQGNQQTFRFVKNHHYDHYSQVDGQNLEPCSRAEAYACDVAYGTNNEFGFDYLRDNMVPRLVDKVQRPLYFAIVDEVDSILIDEARTPLIISAPAAESTGLYKQFAALVPRLRASEDYTVDEKERVSSLTEAGIAKMERMLGIKNIYETDGIALVHHLEEALKAQTLFKKDRDYIVKDGEIIIVDEFTGRLMEGRRYSEGLHQAIEAKEEVEVKQESQTLATISFQNYFRLYEKLAGMTGTAATEAEEFYKIYKLDVVEISTHKPVVRHDYTDRIYKTEDAKWEAVAADINERQERGQPVLVGTVSVEKNERLSKLLKISGVKHEVLNAKHHDREAKIITKAGQRGAVTVATNMAGRGTDIKLGEGIAALGGLCVIGTERHEARRIDNQLRGRAGRQGDPGASQFYVSLDDDLMRIFGGARIKNLMNTLGLPDDIPIENRMISRSIEAAQRKVEGHNFDIRKHLVEYDDVMNKHREVIYRKRNEILAKFDQGQSIKDEIQDIVVDEVRGALLAFVDDEEGARGEVSAILGEPVTGDLDGEALALRVGEIYAAREKKLGEAAIREIERVVYLRTIDMLWVEHLTTMDELRTGIGLRGYGQRDPLVEYKQEAYRLFQHLLKNIESTVARTILRLEVRVEQPAPVMARPLEYSAPDPNEIGSFADEAEELGVQGPRLEAESRPKAQGRRPEIEDQRSSAGAAGGLSPKGTVPGAPERGVTTTIRYGGKTLLERAAESTAGQTGTIKAAKKVGRNDPCPCGSGKKYKKCHGK